MHVCGEWEVICVVVGASCCCQVGRCESCVHWVLQWSCDSCESSPMCPLAPPPASAVWNQVHVAILVIVEGSAAWYGFVFCFTVVSPPPPPPFLLSLCN